MIFNISSFNPSKASRRNEFSTLLCAKTSDNILPLTFSTTKHVSPVFERESVIVISSSGLFCAFSKSDETVYEKLFMFVRR
ncbi:MAG: hypothetical protein L6V79_05460 [Clostridium sp.]|nr:MAG: hypothetical protein L6V79_05460 [Clostridium sp.]